MDTKKQLFSPAEDNQHPVPAEDFSVEEFSIMELEDRLELQGRCNNNCSCPVDPSGN